MIFFWGGGGVPLDELEIPHINIELDIYLSSKIYEENGHGLDLNYATPSHTTYVFHGLGELG